MRSWPVIKRELRVQSRHGSNVMLRWMGAGGLMIGVWYLLSLRPEARWRMGAVGFPGGWGQREAASNWLEGLTWAMDSFRNQGGQLLVLIALVLQVGIWLVAPFLAVDSVSRESREGTLGLLFLTPLRTGDVVYSKLMVHGWRGVSVYLAAVPILMVPILLGGVTWLEVAGTALELAGVLILALMAGLLASSLWEGLRGAWIGSAGLALGFLVIWVGLGSGVEAMLDLVSVGKFGVLEWLGRTWDGIEMVFRQVLGLLQYPSSLANLRPSRVNTPRELLEQGIRLAMALVLAGVALRVSVNRVRDLIRSEPRVERENWKEGERKGVGMMGDGKVAGEEKRRVEAGESRWRERLMGWMRDRLPWLWTEVRSWRGHVVPWLILGILLPVEAWRATHVVLWDGFEMGPPTWMLVGIVGLASASCFHGERASGVLEVLLTLPRGTVRLMRGKVAGLMLQALPATLLLLGVETRVSALDWEEHKTSWTVMMAPMGWLAARVLLAVMVGAWVGLRIRTLGVAWMGTVVAVVALVTGSGGLARAVAGGMWGNVPPQTLAAGFELGLAMVLMLGVIWELKRQAMIVRTVPT